MYVCVLDIFLCWTPTVGIVDRLPSYYTMAPPPPLQAAGPVDLSRARGAKRLVPATTTTNTIRLSHIAFLSTKHDNLTVVLYITTRWLVLELPVYTYACSISFMPDTYCRHCRQATQLLRYDPATALTGGGAS